MEKAAKARKERTELKYRLTNMSLPELLTAAQSDEDVIGRMKVSALLETLPGIDRANAMRIMERLLIPMSRRVRNLSSRLRAALELEVTREQTSLLRQQEQAKHEQVKSAMEISLETQLTRRDPSFRSGTGAHGVFHLKIPWADQENVRRALRESGATPLREADDGILNLIENIPEFAVIFVAASSGAWLCIRAAIKGLAEQNRYKTFRFTLPGGAQLEVDGYSIDQLTAIVQLVSEQYAEHLKETENSHDLRQALAQAARELLDHRENWPADEEIDFYFKQAVRLVDNPGSDGQEKLPKWVASAVERIRELNPGTDGAPAGTGDAERVLDEVTKILIQLAAPPHAPAKNSPREQGG